MSGVDYVGLWQALGLGEVPTVVKRTPQAEILQDIDRIILLMHLRRRAQEIVAGVHGNVPNETKHNTAAQHRDGEHLYSLLHRHFGDGGRGNVGENWAKMLSSQNQPHRIPNLGVWDDSSLNGAALNGTCGSFEPQTATTTTPSSRCCPFLKDCLESAGAQTVRHVGRSSPSPWDFLKAHQQSPGAPPTQSSSPQRTPSTRNSTTSSETLTAKNVEALQVIRQILDKFGPASENLSSVLWLVEQFLLEQQGPEVFLRGAHLLSKLELGKLRLLGKIVSVAKRIRTTEIKKTMESFEEMFRLDAELCNPKSAECPTDGANDCKEKASESSVPDACVLTDLMD